MEHVQYLVDERGAKSAIVIPLQGNEAAIEEFLEDLYGHRIIQERKNEKTMSLKRLVKGLEKDGLL